ncbi:putative cinnamyl alcohol dehydrogenase 9 [Turnera subulata]|uniref:Cinnamyl alcohol dehydrogenase 9 n=1 Tax=Turnera subulata TaxID=218843 RepID=A0A9Q0JDT6_9ROSI|nr:putative cinnamyl alcohol dehydrogenase 9 [Turnera subulata]
MRAASNVPFCQSEETAASIAHQNQESKEEHAAYLFTEQIEGLPNYVEKEEEEGARGPSAANEPATKHKTKPVTKAPEDEHPHKTFGYGNLSPFHFSRRFSPSRSLYENGDDDVAIKILYCRVCHTDLHAIKNEWGVTRYPVVPGSCEYCSQDKESYCPKLIFTYDSIYHDGTKNYGGYSDMIVVDQYFVVRFPDSLPSDAGAPLLCAGITVYSPMKYYGMTEPGKYLGVVGLGGVGHAAVKCGKAFGLKITVISTSPSKEAEAIGKLGADSFLVSSDPAKMKASFGTMDYIIDTVSAFHAIAPLLTLLKPNGKLVTLGLPAKPLELHSHLLVLGRKLVGGSDIGGMKETQEMLYFCAKHNITADVDG